MFVNQNKEISVRHPHTGHHVMIIQMDHHIIDRRLVFFLLFIVWVFILYDRKTINQENRIDISTCNSMCIIAYSILKVASSVSKSISQYQRYNRDKKERNPHPIDI
jgi:hypothetical protein